LSCLSLERWMRSEQTFSKFLTLREVKMMRIRWILREVKTVISVLTHGQPKRLSHPLHQVSNLLDISGFLETGLLGGGLGLLQRNGLVSDLLLGEKGSVVWRKSGSTYDVRHVC
jgi:hypothetical protein